MTNATIVSRVTDYLLNDIEELKDVVREIVSWNGQLDRFDVTENDEDFFNMHFEGQPLEAVRATFYGDYRYMDEYVRFNGYGNLESLTEYQLESELKDSIDEIVALLIEEHPNLSLSEELEELLEEDEDEEEDEE